MHWGLALLFLAAAGNAAAEPISTGGGEHRLLLWQIAVVGERTTFVRAWAAEQAACTERDLIVRPIRPGAESEALRVDPAATVILLVGKDGGVKGRWTAPVAPAKVFAMIDAMPMRRAEMERK